MRALLAALLFGAITMSEAVADDKKKEEPKVPDLKTKDSFTEKMTLREFGGGMLLNPVKDVPAVYGELEGKKVAWVIAPKCPKGSELTDQKTGDVFTVETSTMGKYNFAFHLCYIKKKPAEKKP